MTMIFMHCYHSNNSLYIFFLCYDFFAEKKEEGVKKMCINLIIIILLFATCMLIYLSLFLLPFLYPTEEPTAPLLSPSSSSFSKSHRHSYNRNDSILECMCTPTPVTPPTRLSPQKKFRCTALQNFILLLFRTFLQKNEEKSCKNANKMMIQI